MATLLIGRSEAASLLDPASIVPAVRDAFVAYSAGSIDRAQRVEAWAIYRAALQSGGARQIDFLA